MKPKVRELLQEFIERDLSFSEMNDVISILNELEGDSELIIHYNKIGDESLAEYFRRQWVEDKSVLTNVLEDLSLDYQIDDLI